MIYRYTDLYKSGKLFEISELLIKQLTNCNLCPHNCNANRLQGKKGFCKTGEEILIANYCDHHGEEPPISGTMGSGTIFFANCNLRCVYCQNHQISQSKNKNNFNENTPKQLADIMLHLQNKKVHNINLVSPSHYIAQITQAIYFAAENGLNIPIVYNSNGYDKPESIKYLDGIIDIYLPDIKYASNLYARKYSAAKEYVINTRNSVLEMYKQVGDLVVDYNGIAVRGLIIRLLVLPNDISETIDTLHWIKHNLGTSVFISLMSQYYPAHNAQKVPLLSRKLNYGEYSKVEEELINLGFTNGFLQGMEAPDYYRPDFESENHPFEKDRPI